MFDVIGRIAAIFVVIGLVSLFGLISGCKFEPKDGTTFAIETFAMAAGYEAKQRGFEINEELKGYYEAIMAGSIDLAAAKKAEAYLREYTHPVIANRMVKLAQMSGFTFDTLNHVSGIENVDMDLLQSAVQGFKTGLDLSEAPGTR